MADKEVNSSGRSDDLQRASEIDRICDRYEEDLRNGADVAIKPFLEQVDAESRSQLLHELLEIRVSMIQRQEDRPGMEVLLQEYPEYAKKIYEADTIQEAGSGERMSQEANVELLRQIQPTERYEGGKEVARGGMGAINLANDRPLRRRVAVKSMLANDSSPDELARFIEEAQITGQLDHPGIVPVYELGVDDDGQPFYSMKFVHGRDLQNVLDGLRKGNPAHIEEFPLRRLLMILSRVCEAVAFAHARGVIHRDLKPANIRIGEFGEVIVMDWGLAKILNRSEPGEIDQGDAVIHKVESIRGVDASGDFHTLAGSVMGSPQYMAPEQATGAHELDERADIYALGAILYEMLTLRSPVKTEPGDTVQVLLDRVASSEIPVPRPAGNRRFPEALAKVSMKALAREPDDRYAEVRGFQHEIESWLGGFATDAEEASLMRQVKLFVARNRIVSAAAAIIALLLVVAFAVNRHQRDLAIEARDAAKAQKTVAEAATADSLAVLHFFENEVLTAPRPKGQGLGIKVTMKESLDAAEPRIGVAFEERPLVEASIRDTLGDTYGTLTDWKSALKQHRRALELRTEQLGVNHPDTLAVMMAVGVDYMETGQHVEGLKWFEKALPLYRDVRKPDSEELLKLQSNIAKCYVAMGRYTDAMELLEETLKTGNKVFGPEHPTTLNAMDSLASTYRLLRRIDDALQLWEETLARRKRSQGVEHPRTLGTMMNLAIALQQSNRPEEALDLMNETIAVSKRELGEGHGTTLLAMMNLANLHQAAGRDEESISLLEEVIRSQKKWLGPRHPSTMISMVNLARSYDRLDKIAEAIDLLTEALELQREALGSQHPDTIGTVERLANILTSIGRYAEAEKHHREYFTTRAKQGSDDWSFHAQQMYFGLTLSRLGKHAEAETLLLASEKGLDSSPWHDLLQQCREGLVEVYTGWKKPGEAAKWKARLEEL